MRVGLVSTYPPIECGIATYTQYLEAALRKSGNETFVMSQYGAQGRSVFPVFEAGSASFATDVYNVSIRMTPDLVHIQHEYGLYGAQRGVSVIELILRYKLAGIPVAITLHTVSEELNDDEQLILKHIIDDCSAVIVHEEFQRETLLKYFGHLPDAKDKIHVIEHGVRELPQMTDAKSKLELEGKKVILICGYFRPSKGFHRIIDIFPGICAKEEDAVLVVAGKVRNIEFSDYRTEFFTKLNESPVSDRITILRGQFPQHTFDTIVAAADVVVMPYEIGAQSGVMAQCFAQGVPVVTSDLPAFNLLIDRSKGGFVAKSDADYERLILEILQNEGTQAELKKNIGKYVKDQAGWTPVAKQHSDVYHSIVKTPYGKARYVYFPEPGEES
jgi:1,2-diacylglycerol 3-alpha-glucosyltransferase